MNAGLVLTRPKPIEREHPSDPHAGMNEDKRPLTLKGRIEPKHMLQAIENSLSHSDETAHGVTGLTFRNYTIIIHKRKGLSWYIECKFKRGRRDSLAGLNVNLVT